MMRYDATEFRTDTAVREEALAMRRWLTTVPVAVVLLGSLGLCSRPLLRSKTVIPRFCALTGALLPETLDPQHSDLGQWSMSGGLDYEGLTRIDEELQPIPGAAESWEFSPDGTTVTFHLRDGLVFSDGVPVTAEHFRYAAERVCSPELNSRSRGVSSPSSSAARPLFTAGMALAAGEAAFGVRVLDDQTLEYRFTQPAPYFPAQAAVWRTIPLRQDLIEAGGPNWWANPAMRIGNGPFRTGRVRTRTGRTNASSMPATIPYWGGPTRLDRIEFVFHRYHGDPAIEGYRRGEFDVIWPRSQMIPALEADPALSRDLVPLPIAGTGYFQFNLTREPFQDPKVREAFAYAFDREDYCAKRYDLVRRR